VICAQWSVEKTSTPTWEYFRLGMIDQKPVGMQMTSLWRFALSRAADIESDNSRGQSKSYRQNAPNENV